MPPAPAVAAGAARSREEPQGQSEGHGRRRFLPTPPPLRDPHQEHEQRSPENEWYLHYFQEVEHERRDPPNREERPLHRSSEEPPQRMNDYGDDDRRDPVEQGFCLRGASVADVTTGESQHDQGRRQDEARSGDDEPPPASPRKNAGQPASRRAAAGSTANARRVWTVTMLAMSSASPPS